MMSDEFDAVDAAREFLKIEMDVWTAWVSEEAAGRVQASLN